MTDTQRALQAFDDMLSSLSFFKADASGADLIRGILKDYEKDKQYCLSAQKHTMKLIDRVQALVNALEFYALDENHHGVTCGWQESPPCIQSDQGKIAKQALAAFRDKT